MIQGLVERLLTILQQAFADGIADVDQHVVAGPVPAPDAAALPLIALSPGELELESRVRDESTSQPRPREIRETIATNETIPAGPYSLERTPLAGSLRCRVVFEQGQLAERSVTLTEGRDFTVDPAAPSIAFTGDVAGSDQIRLIYSFAGIFTVRELRQQLLADVYGQDAGTVEGFASLVAGVVLTDQDELLEHVNRVAPTTYAAGRYATRHVFDRLVLTGGAAVDSSDGIVHQRLRFRATGRLEATREVDGGFGLIERVHSPGRVSEHPVDVEPELANGPSGSGFFGNLTRAVARGDHRRDDQPDDRGEEHDPDQRQRFLDGRRLDQ